MKLANKNSDGFTLVEFLATIALLVILMLIVIPSAIKVFKKSDVAMTKAQLELVCLSADTYTKRHEISYKVYPKCLPYKALTDEKDLPTDVAFKKLYEINKDKYIKIYYENNIRKCEIVNQELNNCEEDDDPVKLVLNGNPTQSIEILSKYNELGAKIINSNTNEEIFDKELEISGSVNNNKTGEYILTYSIKGTIKPYTKVTRKVTVTPIEYAFPYTGSEQTFNVKNSGNYKIELWGASGGNAKNGGYTSGDIYLNQSENLFIQVGETGKMSVFQYAYNGGGRPGYNDCDYPQGANRGCGGYVPTFGGGGATDIRLTSGAWNDVTSLRSRIMVAGGGGASGGYSISDSAGGGLVGGNGTSGRYSVDYSYPYTSGKGGTQTGVITINGTTSTSKTIYYNNLYQYLSYNVSIVNANYATGGDGGRQFGFVGGFGGGGGYYGGQGGWGEYAASTSGGGGSSFISGHNGCNAINTSGTHTNQANHFSGKVFTNTTMIDGAGYNWTNAKGGLTTMPNPLGGTFPNTTGNNGNGYAKITYYGK